MKTTALLPILSMLLSMSPTAQIIHVPGDQNTIQAGIDAANPGDTVLVSDGTYLENISFMGKAILVTSHFLVDGDTNHIHNTIIDGGDPEDPLHGSVVEFPSEEDTTSIIYGFTITGGTGMYLESQQARIGGGIVCYNATAKISHNRITDNEVSDISNAWGGGIAVHREAGEQWVVIENNIIRENRAIVDNGIAAGGGSLILGDARIYSNLVENNYCTSESNESAGGGFYCQSLNELPDTLKFPHNTVQNNSVDGKEAASGGGIFFRGLFATISENVIRYNTLKGNVARGGGIYFEEGMISDITANLFASNTLNTTNNEWWGGGGSVSGYQK